MKKENKEDIIYKKLVNIVSSSLGVSRGFVLKNKCFIHKVAIKGINHFMITITRNAQDETILDPILIHYDSNAIYNDIKSTGEYKEYNIFDCEAMVGVSNSVMGYENIGKEAIVCPVNIQQMCSFLKIYLDNYIKGIDREHLLFKINGRRNIDSETKGYMVSLNELQTFVGIKFKKINKPHLEAIGDCIDTINSCINNLCWEKHNNLISKKDGVIDKYILTKKRNKKMVQIAKYRAHIHNGSLVCEYCKKHHDILDEVGIPYIEVHHIIALNEGGKDDYNNMIVLCPVCHKQAHHGSRNRRESMKNDFFKIVDSDNKFIDMINTYNKQNN